MWKTTNKRPNRDLTTEEAKEKALNLLEYRAHSRKELYDKLKRVTSAEIAAEVIAVLADGGLLDDETYAYQYAHDAMELKNLGPARIKRELAQRGIDDDTAENAIWAAERETGSFEEHLDALLAVKYKNCLSDKKNRAKTVNSLFRMGYEYGMIKIAISKVKEDILDEWNGNEGE